MNLLRYEKNKQIENNIIKGGRNIFRTKQEIDGNKTKGARNLFNLKKENEAINVKIMRDTRNLFKSENKEEQVIFGKIVISSMKILKIEIK